MGCQVGEQGDTGQLPGVSPKLSEGVKRPFSLSASGGFFQGSESPKNPCWGQGAPKV